MGHSLRTKIMTGVIALLFLFAGALGTTLYLVNDSDEEVGGILKYHLPVLTRLNALDVVTYEIEVIAHRLTDEGAPSKERIEEIHARIQKCRDQIETIFHETKVLLEGGSKDSQNDLEDRLEMARLIGSLDSLKSEVDRFSRAAALPVELMSQGKGEEAQKAIGNLRNFEYLDPIITSVREKANRLTIDSLKETHGNIFNIIWTNAVLFLSASVLGFLVFLLITGRLQKAFRGLICAFHETADGKYSSPLPVTSEDEIGELTTSFNTMVEQLKSKEKMGFVWPVPRSPHCSQCHRSCDGRTPPVGRASEGHHLLFRYCRLQRDRGTTDGRHHGTPPQPIFHGGHRGRSPESRHC